MVTERFKPGDAVIINYSYGNWYGRTGVVVGYEDPEFPKTSWFMVRKSIPDELFFTDPRDIQDPYDSSAGFSQSELLPND